MERHHQRHTHRHHRHPQRARPMLEAYYNPLQLRQRGAPLLSGTLSFAGQFDYFSRLCELLYNVTKNGQFVPLVFFRQTNLLPSMADHYTSRFNAYVKLVLDADTRCVMIDWEEKDTEVLAARLSLVIRNIHMAVGRTTFKQREGIIEQAFNVARMNEAINHFIRYDLQIHLVEERLRGTRIRGQTTNVAQY